MIASPIAALNTLANIAYITLLRLLFSLRSKANRMLSMIIMINSTGKNTIDAVRSPSL
jgi:hypothetical protein